MLLRYSLDPCLLTGSFLSTLHLSPVKGTTPARAYIYFKNERLAVEFQRMYHGHVFMDKNGNEGRAFVEFAPFQKVPRIQRKPDPKQGTIEEGECRADPREFAALLRTMPIHN